MIVSLGKKQPQAVSVTIVNGQAKLKGLVSKSSVIEPEGFPTRAVTRAMAKKGSEKPPYQGSLSLRPS